MVKGFRCPMCSETNRDQVVETRKLEDTILRMRRCTKCRATFTTIEQKDTRKEFERIWVLKRDGRLEKFDERKVRYGINLAFNGVKQVTPPEVNEIGDRVVAQVISKGGKEIKATEIGDFILEELIREPKYHIAYVKFASVYLRAQDVGELVKILDDVIKKPHDRLASYSPTDTHSPTEERANPTHDGAKTKRTATARPAK